MFPFVVVSDDNFIFELGWVDLGLLKKHLQQEQIAQDWQFCWISWGQDCFKPFKTTLIKTLAHWELRTQ